jgi:hypothetical protein
MSGSYDPNWQKDPKMSSYFNDPAFDKQAPEIKKAKASKPAVKKAEPVACATPPKKTAALVERPEVKRPEVKRPEVKPVEAMLQGIEQRFLECAEFSGVDLSVYPLTEQAGLQVSTDKGRSDTHGEVFTPLWLVDKMLDRVDDRLWKDQDKTTEDLCAGRGQFTIRMMRKKYSLLGEGFDLSSFLGDTHLFIELQPRSCFLLLYTFGSGIRLLMGDAAKKGLLDPAVKDGIWVWSDTCGKWLDGTSTVIELFEGIIHGGLRASQELADEFETKFVADKKIELEDRALKRSDIL